MHALSGGLWSRRVVLGLAAVVMLAGAPSTAKAGCLEEAIASCRKDFPNTSEKLIGILGWCYMIRIAMCELLDGKSEAES